MDHTTSHLDTTDPAAGAHAVEPVVAARVLRRFRLVLNVIRTHFQQVGKKVGVGGAQVWALHVVQQRPGLGVHALAQM